MYVCVCVRVLPTWHVTVRADIIGAPDMHLHYFFTTVDVQIDPKKRITVAEALAHPWIIEGGTAEDKNLNFNLKAGLRAYLKV